MDAATLVSAQLYARKLLAKTPTGIVYLGDSITANANKTSGSLSYTSIDSPVAWAQHLSGYRFKQLYNAGIASNTTTQMVARFATDVAAYSPQVVHIEGGTNDAVTGVSSSTIIANLTTLIARSQAIGARVIVSGIPPRNALTSGQRTVRNTVNRWLADNARILGYLYVPVDKVLTDTTSSQNYGTDLSQDGTHPTGPAALKWGTLIAQAIVALGPSSETIPGHQYDPNLLTLNMQQIGTGSTPGTGITGALAPSWSASALNGTVTATSSKVARTDTTTGEWQQFTIAVQSATTTAVRQQISATTGYTAGTDSVYAFAEYQLDADLTSLADLSLNLSTVASGSSVVQTVQSMSNTSGTVSTSGHMTKYAAFSLSRTGTLVTDSVLIDPTATSSVNLELRFAGLGTVRWGRAGIMKV